MGFLLNFFKSSIYTQVAHEIAHHAWINDGDNKNATAA